MDRDKTAVKRAGAYGYVVGLQGFEKFWRFFDRSRQVGVREEHAPTTCFAHPVTNAEALPSIHSIGNQPQGWKCLPKGFSDFCRAILRAIIDDQNFRVSSQTRQLGGDLFESRREAQLFVVGRNNDR